ncbi:pyridoxamine 5'-phosphate oxidase family protein [Pontixanthobacter sp.]|uniref:pyridoxamine 5'-phosphate oxidase family protein n=1 Tax=Pontixanthobacter sp. TaxID=2792078 RepID=UPI003C799BC3
MADWLTSPDFGRQDRIMKLTFEDVIQDITDRLTAGANSRKSAMHTAVVATADCDVRVMVLREYDPALRRLRFHTDARSPKVAVIRDNPLVSVLVYDAEAKVQIRMRGQGIVATTSPQAEAAWDAATNFAKRCYLAKAGPSSVSAEQTSGLPDWAEGINPTDAQVADARQNFALLYVTVTEFDWLYLANTGHRRAKVSVTPDLPGWTADWLVP